MGRAPCCAKIGLKKGPWSQDEDQLLISYIQQNGHPNWRALPKLAGLLRCGKSCRLRWTNYLRPDIKRGSFSKEEEDTIVRLHEMLGNRWSVIAAKLPGRTDNEIKNVWHTYLKKRLESNQTTIDIPKKRRTKPKDVFGLQNVSEEIKICQKKLNLKKLESKELSVPQCNAQQKHNSLDEKLSVANQPSSSDSSSITDAAYDSSGVAKYEEIDHETFLDDSFWSETLSGEGDSIVESNQLTNISSFGFPIEMTNTPNLNACCDTDGIDLWYDIFSRIEELTELPEF